MAVNRYKGSIHTVSGNHTDFPLWLFLSIAIHLIPAIVIVLIPRVPHREFRPPVYQVELMTRPEADKAEEAPKNEEFIPHEEPKVEPNVKVEVKDIKHTANIVKHKPEMKPKKKGGIPKHKDDEESLENALDNIKKKVADDEALDKALDNIKKKVTASSGGIKMAAKAPAKVYHYEELDDEMKVYYDKIKQIVRNAWILPDVLRNKGYKTILAIHVLKDGTVQSLWIEEKSGNNFYDETAVRAINKVTLPPLPNVWKDESIDLGFNF